MPSLHMKKHTSAVALHCWRQSSWEVYKDVEYSVWSWTSALVDDCDTLNSRHLIALVDEHLKVPLVTDEQLVSFVKYNLEVLESGVHPHEGWNGVKLDKARAKKAGLPLAGGHTAALFGIQADAKEKVKIHRFSRN